MDEQKQILKLAAEIANMDLQALEQGWRRKLLILDGQIESLKDLENEYRARLAEMDEAIVHLRALYKINLKVLGIVNAPQKTPINRNRRNDGIKVNLTQRGKRVSPKVAKAERQQHY